ncbi:MAG: serine/threonine-protein kinase [Enhygromyxa sp.]
MLEPDTQIVPPRGQDPAVEAPPGPAGPDAGAREEPLVLRRWVGRYELIHRLAHGGMATVYLGRAKGKAGFEKVVAVKVIHPHLAGEAEFVGMFLDEARIAARLHHPHVVEILDLGESDGVYFMVMEFIEGENLSALVRALDGERLPVPVILQIIADTLEGLGAAHELQDADGRPYKLVHRDVSPHNILINLDGWAKVGDFGIMKAAGKASNTKTGELRGKLAYMSPEQARGVAVDHRTDLFALGVIAWELLTGERLFACATEAATLEKVIACEVPRLAERGFVSERPALGEGLQGLLDRALASDPQQRYPDAAAMLAEVKRLLRMVEELPGALEPRAYLGDSMRRFFQRRVEYARAALRRLGEDGGRRLGEDGGRRLGEGGRELPAPTSREWTVEPTTPVARAPTGPQAPIDRTPSGAVAARVQTGSNPTLSSSASHPQLSGVSPSPLVQWSLWLLLPMLGAGIAIAAMLLFGPSLDPRAEPSEQPEPPPVEPPKSPTSLAATEYQPVPQRPTPPGQVRWYFSTTPRGARVSIDGELRGDPTPTWVYLPIGEDPLDIRIELDGYQPLTLQLPAIHDQTFSEALEPLAPLAVEAKDKPPKRARKPGKVKAPRGKGEGTEQPDGKPSSGSPGFVPAPDSLRDGNAK